MPDRRFRDMRLTEEEAHAIVLSRGRFLPSLPKREKRLARAKRLLPLWRDWGLRDIERENANLKFACHEHLQSQLAWTPVSDGLPTEPGFYLFSNKERDVALYRLNDTVTRWKWENVQGTKLKDEAIAAAWSSFRSIELPKDEARPTSEHPLKDSADAAVQGGRVTP